MNPCAGYDPHELIDVRPLVNELATLIIGTKEFYDLPRKFTQTMQIPAAGGAKPTTTTTEGTYSDFGTDVEIEEPPTSEVTEQPGM